MQVQRVQNNNYNPNFQALRIKYLEKGSPISLTWNAETLDRFVKNKEIQKFVKLFDDLGKDVEVWCGRGDWDKSETDKITLDIINKKSGKHETSLYFLTDDELKNFQAEEQLLKCNININNWEKNEKLIEDAKNFVDEFNNSLEKNTITSTTNNIEQSKKWWQIWK